MESDKEIFERLIAGGIIGAAVGHLISDSKQDGIVIGAIVGASILATFKANEQAKKLNIPFYEQIDDALYEIQANGEHRFIKKIPRIDSNFPLNFKLK